jgi:hypothetical protein
VAKIVGALTTHFNLIFFSCIFIGNFDCNLVKSTSQSQIQCFEAVCCSNKEDTTFEAVNAGPQLGDDPVVHFPGGKNIEKYQLYRKISVISKFRYYFYFLVGAILRPSGQFY